jgi:hypothetical protein
MTAPLFPSDLEECEQYQEFLANGGNAVFSEPDDDQEDDQEEDEDEPWDGFRDDVEADADALASAGWGTDEDYGYYGEE